MVPIFNNYLLSIIPLLFHSYPWQSCKLFCADNLFYTNLNFFSVCIEASMIFWNDENDGKMSIHSNFLASSYILSFNKILCMCLCGCGCVWHIITPVTRDCKIKYKKNKSIRENSKVGK